MFQKWVKKYNGSSDPYNHLASFKQVLRAKQVNNFHTKGEQFGLTLEGCALSWFQTLNVLDYLSYKALEKDFIKAFAKMGIKHTNLNLIYNFNRDHLKPLDNAQVDKKHTLLGVQKMRSHVKKG